MGVELLGWVVATGRGNTFVTRIPGREIRVKVQNQSVAKSISDAVARGSEVLIRFKVESLNGGVARAYDVHVLHSGINPPTYSSVDPSKPSEFSLKSFIAMRLPKYQKVIKVQHAILRSLRRFLDGEGYTELLPPVISTASNPGLRGARRLKTRLYGSTYELVASVTMFKQITATALGKVYFIARNVREEPPENAATWRHLVEFTQLSVECAGASMEDMMELGERLLYRVCVDVLSEVGDIVREFNPGLRCPSPPFRRVTYSEAVRLVRRLGEQVPKDGELTQKGEEALSKHFEEPFWVINYPSRSRSFYFLQDPENPNFNRDFNLILPLGYGEVMDGGEHEYRYEKVLAKLKKLGEPLEKYSWFLEALRVGISPSAGFGIGIERLTRYVLRLKYVWEATPFPKPPGVVGAP